MPLEQEYGSQILVDKFLSELKRIGGELGLTIEEDLSKDKSGRVSILFSHNFPMRLNIVINSDEKAAFMYGIVRTYGFNGDRSDFHYLISSLWAVFLRTSNIASVRLVDEQHEFVDGEISSRYILFDKQPPASFINLNAPDFEVLRQILERSMIAAWSFSSLYSLLDGGVGYDEYHAEEGRQWAGKVLSQIGMNVSSANTEINYHERSNPYWSYVRSASPVLFAIDLGVSLFSLISSESLKGKSTILEGVSCKVISSMGIKNAIPHDSIKLADKLLGAWGQNTEVGESGHNGSLVLNERAVLIPIESHLIVLTDGGIFSLEQECGLGTYTQEKERLLERHQIESKILFSSTQFVWNQKIDDDEFEQLILELLNREAGVRWAYKIGKGRAPDLGRDIMAEWYLGPSPHQPVKEENLFELKRILVQCKAYQKQPVNMSAVNGLLEILYLHQAQGYLLVAFCGLTEPLIRFLETLPDERMQYWARWWTRKDIEDKLRANRDIAQRYLHLFKMIEIDM
ncbi:MAG TPA: restriction endonuclease [Pyrinomonadaceae bacterium]